MSKVTILCNGLYFGATEYDENFNNIPAGNGWCIHTKLKEDGRYSLVFSYIDADNVEHQVTEI